MWKLKKHDFQNNIIIILNLLTSHSLNIYLELCGEFVLKQQIFLVACVCVCVHAHKDWIIPFKFFFAAFNYAIEKAT